jgi:hypothetical protein
MAQTRLPAAFILQTKNLMRKKLDLRTEIQKAEADVEEIKLTIHRDRVQ